MHVCPQVESAADFIAKASTLHNLHIDHVSVRREKSQSLGQSGAATLGATLAILRALPQAPHSLYVQGLTCTPAALNELQHVPEWEKLSLCLDMPDDNVSGTLHIPHSYESITLQGVTGEQAEALMAGLVQSRPQGPPLTINVPSDCQSWVDSYRARLSEQPHITLTCYQDQSAL